MNVKALVYGLAELWSESTARRSRTIFEEMEKYMTPMPKGGCKRIEKAFEYANFFGPSPSGKEVPMCRKKRGGGKKK